MLGVRRAGWLVSHFQGSCRGSETHLGAGCPPAMPVTGLCGSHGAPTQGPSSGSLLVTPSFEHLLFIGGDQAETGINFPKYYTGVEKMSSVILRSVHCDTTESTGCASDCSLFSVSLKVETTSVHSRETGRTCVVGTGSGQALPQTRPTLRCR